MTSDPSLAVAIDGETYLVCGRRGTGDELGMNSTVVGLELDLNDVFVFIVTELEVLGVANDCD